MIAILALIFVADIVGLEEYGRRYLLGQIGAVKQNLQVEKIDRESLESKVGDLEAELQTLKNQNEILLGNIQNKIGEISGTVGALDKLNKTDRELLQKYSKTYFLNEHYVPLALANIDPDFIYVKDKIFKIHTNVYQYIERLLVDAKAAGLHLGVVSAYRSFGTQSVLKSGYKFTYGAGTANQFSAEQGYSEHQLGTAADFATLETSGTFAGFSKTPEYVWLVANAQKYGFILSYPENNPYYQYEPWHWRFVGIALATRLHDEGNYFYNLDQREINTYLANIFD